MSTDPASFQTPHGLGNRVARLAWQVFWLVCFRPTPWFLGAYRTWLLRLWGARLGQRVRFSNTTRVWAPWRLRAGDDVYVDANVYLYNTFGLEFGSRVVVSFGTTLCTPTHDFRKAGYPLVGKPIVVGDDVWIAAEAFVLPGVAIGSGAVVGARSLVVADVAPWTVVGGNPAKMVATRAIITSEAPAPSA